MSDHLFDHPIHDLIEPRPNIAANGRRRPRPQRIHEHSREAYKSTEVQAKLGERDRSVLATVRQCGPMTDREVKLALGFEDMNNVRPTITRLVAMDLLIENGSTKCQESGRKVRLVQVPRHG